MSRKYKRSKRSKKMSPKSRRCKNLLKKKVLTNIREYGKGRYKSRSQAIAVAYSQVKKSNPSCKSVFRRRNRGSGPRNRGSGPRNRGSGPRNKRSKSRK
jgi:hypothetical protein